MVFLFFSLWAFGTACVGIAASADLKFSLSLDKNAYGPNEPVVASFSLKNEGKKPVWVNKRFYVGSETMAKDKRDVFLLVETASGKKLPCKFSYETGLPKSDYFVALEPGKEVSSEYPRNLKGYFDLNEPGTYKAVAVYENVFGREIGLETFKESLRTELVAFTIKASETTEKRAVAP